MIELIRSRLGQAGATHASWRELAEAAGLSHGGLSRTYATGLLQCLRHPRLVPAFLETALEPTIRAVEARLQTHIDSGEMMGESGGTIRAAALMLISRLRIAHLHQSELGGADSRPLDLDSFAAQVAEAFISAHSARKRALRQGSRRTSAYAAEWEGQHPAQTPIEKPLCGGPIARIYVGNGSAGVPRY